MTTVELSPYLVLVLVGFLPNEIWRALGLVLARGLNEDSEIVVWSRAVASHSCGGHRQAHPFSKRYARQQSACRTHSRSGVRVCCLHLHQTVGVCRRSCRRGDALARRFPVRALAHTVSMAAASFFACSASTSGFSFSLAGGFIVTPA